MYKDITQEKFKEMVGTFEVSFTEYYKYKFYFKYEDSCTKIVMALGGTSEDIYREDVSKDDKYLIEEREWYSGTIYSLQDEQWVETWGFCE